MRGGTPGRGWRPARLVSAGLVALLLLALVGVPLGALLRVALGGGWRDIAAALADPAATRAIRHTVEVAVSVTVLAVGLGGALAVAVERGLVPAARATRAAVVVPLLVPQFVLGVSWSEAYGPAGATDRLLGVALPGLLGPAGVVVVLTVHELPLAYLVVAGGLAVRGEPDLERAARSAGAGPWTVLSTVTLPLLRGPLLAAAALVFVGAVNSFAVPQVLGTPAGYSTLSTLVYQDLALSADPDAFAHMTVLALLMAVLVLGVIGAADLVLAALWSQPTRTGPAGPRARPAPRRAREVAAATVAAYVALAVAVPLVVLAATAITRGPGLPPLPRNWTLDNFAVAFSGEAGAALLRTLALSGAAALLATVMAGVVVGLGRRTAGSLAATVTLAYAVPGTALAVGVILAYGRWLLGSALLVLVAYLAKFWALAHRPLAAAAGRTPPELALAARSAGASAAVALRTVTLPLMATAAVTGAGLVFLFGLHELTMSSILYGPGSQTFAVVVLNQQQLGNTGATAALAVVLTLPLLLLAGAAALLLRRRDRAASRESVAWAPA